MYKIRPFISTFLTAYLVSLRQWFKVVESQSNIQQLENNVLVLCEFLSSHSKLKCQLNDKILKCLNAKQNFLIQCFHVDMFSHNCFSRLYWSVDIWTAGTLGRELWMMVVELLYHGKHYHSLRIWVNL